LLVVIRRLHLLGCGSQVRCQAETDHGKGETLRIVLELRKEGLSYDKIIRRIEDEHGIALRKSHLSGWISGNHKPFGFVSAFDETPRAELAYVIGVSLGDASTSSNRNHSHKIKLRVIDREFAFEFARCLGVLLCRSPPLVKWREKTHSWHTEVSSLLLQNFLKQPLELLKQVIEHCKRVCEKSALWPNFLIMAADLTASIA
jgi:intein-encoded DNA endonuclease-like protein